MSSISTLPPAPSRSDPATFSDKADALLGALDGFVSETNVVVGEVLANKDTAVASAATATTQASNASTSASTASTQASNASSSASSASTSASTATTQAGIATAAASTATTQAGIATAAAASINLASPAAIGNVTPNTGAFTTLSATGATSLSSSGVGSFVANLANNDQANTRLRFTNAGSGGQIWSLVGGTPGSANSGFAVYNETGGATVAQFSSTGLAVTGTLSASGVASHFGATDFSPYWGSYAGLLRFGSSSLTSTASANGTWICNGYVNSSAQTIYSASAEISRIQQFSGSIRFATGVSGTAGAVATLTTVGEFNSTGLAVTGTVSATAGITSTRTTGAAFTASADANYALFDGATNSSGGRFVVTGNTTGSGINAWAYNAAASGYEPFNITGSTINLMPANTTVVAVSSAGAAVTGTLSATNLVTVESTGAGVVNLLLKGPSVDNNWGGRVNLYSSNGTTVRGVVYASIGGVILSADGGTTNHAAISSTGLAVTGTVTATVASGDQTPAFSANSAGGGANLAISAGNGTASSSFAYIRFIKAASSPQEWRVGLYGDNNLTFRNQTAGADVATLDASGNLGLGVTPSAWSTYKALQVSEAANIAGKADGAVFSQNCYFNGTNWINSRASTYACRYDMNVAANGAHAWYTYGSVFGTAGNTIPFVQAMTLDASGNLLVGTASNFGLTRLFVVALTGQTAVVAKTDTAASFATAVWNSGASGDNRFMEFGTEGSYTARGSIDYNRAGGLTRYNTTSDYRAKDVYGPVLDSGAQLDALKVYRGKMKGATQDRPMLIAHEAQEVAPYAVTGTKDAVKDDGTPLFQQVDHSSLVPLLIAEIQSLRTRVAQLEGI